MGQENSAFEIKDPAKIVLFNINGDRWGIRPGLESLVRDYTPIFGRGGKLVRSLDGLDIGWLDRALDSCSGLTDSYQMKWIKYSEAEHIARVFLSPPTKLEQIRKRQQILERLIISDQLTDLINLKNRSYRILEAGRIMNSCYGNHFDDEETLIQVLQQGNTTAEIYDSEYDFSPSGEEDLLPHVREALSLLSKGKEALETLGARDDEIAREVFAGIPVLQNRLRTDFPCLFPMAVFHGEEEFSEENLIKWARGIYDLDHIRDLPNSWETSFFGWGAVLEIARKIRDESWSKVTFDEDKPAGYKQGWNIERQRGDQVRNDSTADVPGVILCGVNTSGKSYFMKADYMVDIAAQSLGYAPVAAGNFRVYRNYLHIDRSSSASSTNLSAFMKEVVNWTTILPDIGSGMRLYVDEGYSTTSPDDQRRLLAGTIEYIRRRGGRVMLATHNDKLFTGSANGSDQKVYHLATEVLLTGKLKRLFRLEEGPSDSMAITVARTLGFPESVLRSAEGYLRGEFILPVSEPSKEYTAIEQYTEEEREERKKEAVSLEHLFPAKTKDAIFHLFSLDGNFNEAGFLGGLKSERDQMEALTEMMPYMAASLQELLGRMILWAPRLSSADILERQKMFAELTTADTQERIHQAVVDACKLDRALTVINRAAVDGINIRLYPFAGEEKKRKNRYRSESEVKSDSFSSDEVGAAVAFLKIQQKLLKDGFTGEELLVEFTQLKDQAFKHSGSIESAEVSALFKKLAVFTKTLPSIPLQDIVIEEIAEELEALKAQGSLAEELLGLSGYIEDSNKLLVKLKEIDSVYLQQSANHLEVLINKALAAAKGQQFGLSFSDAPNATAHSRSKFDHLGKDFEFNKLFTGGNLEGIVGTPLNRELRRVDALCLFADLIKQEGLTAVQFNDTGEIKFDNMFSIFKTKGEVVKNTISLDVNNERLPVLTGPNGSGKTFYEKAVVAAALMGYATGHGPADYLTMPILGGVAYMDRVVKSLDDKLSAYAQEGEYWKLLLPLLESRKPILAVIDEAFSTTAPSYQAALTFGVVAEFLKAGHFLMLATHNHDVVDRLGETGVSQIKPYHFDFTVEDGQVKYKYQLRPGHEKSYAIEAARALGLPEEILSYAQ